jgi:uncharacterized protein YndB with AHSA1/START domain
MSAPELDKLRLEREFEATAEEVFDAWTNPEVLARWWGPAPSWDSVRCAVDLRVGGGYVMRVRDPDSGTELEVGGEYREIDPPRRLVYTWCWAAGGPNPGLVTVVTVEFVALGDRTLVVLEHVGLGTEDSRTRHGEGWNAAFNRLRDAIFGDPEAGRAARLPDSGAPDRARSNDDTEG